MSGRFQITCNFCGSFYHGKPANNMAKMPPNETYVRVCVPHCPGCVDDPARIAQVKERVNARMLEQVALHVVRGDRRGRPS